MQHARTRGPLIHQFRCDYRKFREGVQRAGHIGGGQGEGLETGVAEVPGAMVGAQRGQ